MERKSENGEISRGFFNECPFKGTASCCGEEHLQEVKNRCRPDRIIFELRDGTSLEIPDLILSETNKIESGDKSYWHTVAWENLDIFDRELYDGLSEGSQFAVNLLADMLHTRWVYTEILPECSYK